MTSTTSFKSMPKSLLTGFFALALLLSVTVVGAQAATTAPDFTLTDLDGTQVRLSQFKGKVVLLNFWGTWCMPCRREMPSLNSLYLQYSKDGLVVLALSIDQSDKPVRALMDEKKYSFPVLMDSRKEVYSGTFGLFGLPVTLIINKKGFIVEKVIGERPWDSPLMKDKVLKVLRER